MEIKYKINTTVRIEDVIVLYTSAELNRPINDFQRIKELYENSNLVITAWHQGELVGIARSITDLRYSCYLSDLAVKKEFQKQKIGKTLIKITKEYLGNECILLLLAAPSAINYYSKIGFEQTENAFIIKREF